LPNLDILLYPKIHRILTLFKLSVVYVSGPRYEENPDL